MLFFYNLFIWIYTSGIRLAALWNEKAAAWTNGRKHWRSKLAAQLAAAGIDAAVQTVWMHCASLGEFEQGREIIERLRAAHPQYKIVVSFFSPSGYEVRKQYKGADVVCYLPADTKRNAAAFIKLVNPALVLWVKYDYWYHFLTTLQKQEVQLYLVSGIFRWDQPFFKWYGGLHRKMIACYSWLFVQNEDSRRLAVRFFPGNKISISGDTRFDRVITIANQWHAIPEIERWINGTQQVVVAGSTWAQDEEELVHYAKMHPHIKFIIAPHNVDTGTIGDSLGLFPNSTTFSAFNRDLSDDSTQILIIDNVGMLSRLYHYATICYVGGGFGDDGVHNVLEAAVYGKPVVHGPEFSKYIEAVALEQNGGSFDVEDALELEKLLDKLFSDPDFYNTAAAKAKAFVYNRAGASDMIISFLQKDLKM